MTGRPTHLGRANLGFYLDVDAKGAARAEEVLRRHFGAGDAPIALAICAAL
jgi:hypothetical protein